MAKLETLIQQELSKPNYLIDSNNEYVAIYFSSCGIFGGDNIEMFKSKIMEKNSFEFFKTRVEKASKHIFIRDLQQKWYSKGINNEINSIESLLEFLKQETKGYKIITMGSSAGGYAATLFGILLNAECIFSFSGQFQIPKERSADYNLLKMIKTSVIPIFYMYPCYNKNDVNQFNLIKDFSNVQVLAIKSANHGVPVVKETLRKIINSDIKHLNKMYGYKNKTIGERIFLIKYFGIISFLRRMMRKNILCFVNKYFIKDSTKCIKI